MCPNMSTDFENLEFDPFNSENILGINDQSDSNINLFDRIKLLRTNYFDTDKAIKQIKIKIHFQVFILKNLLTQLNFESECQPYS